LIRATIWSRVGVKPMVWHKLGGPVDPRDVARSWQDLL
jgi:hypothetical protein